MQITENKNQSVKGPSKKKIALFKGISIILIPLLILSLIEVMLRLAHYGSNLSLFIESPQNSDYLIFNPDASKKYFTDQNFATVGYAEPFKKKKDANTIRIFVLGESTGIGYPYFHNGSFHRWLLYRLMHTYPDKNFDIINLSLTAVNSYTVLDFASVVANYEPDAVLIYAGHNEFYGALGAASTQRINGSPFMVNLILRLRELKLTQLITNIYKSLAALHSDNSTKYGENRMQLMAAKQQIPYQSALYSTGLYQYKTNMNAVFSIFNQHHIPVFVSNLVSNEKDLKPFTSFEPTGPKASDFKTNYLNGIKASNSGDFAGAGKYLRIADQEYSNSALCKYYLGRVCFIEGDFAQAEMYFHKAKDLDGLRFRAPEEFNTVLSQLCLQYSNVSLVDTRSAFGSFSDHHIIGDNLILDHVHPNLKGYAIMSDVFYNALTKAKVLPPADPANEMSFQQLLRDMPVCRVDSIAGADRIFNLKEHWPYNDPHAKDSITAYNAEQTFASDLVFRKANWYDTMNALYTYYVARREYKEARDVLENLILEYPDDSDLYQKIAMLSGMLKDDNGALYNFKKSFSFVPSFDKARYIFVLYLRHDQPVSALPYINYAIANNSSGLNVNEIKTYTEKVIQLKEHYILDSTNVKTINEIANSYLLMDNRAGAEKYIEKALKLDSKNSDTKLLISKMNIKPTGNEQNK
jgi:tetratricopeptide (TPR) repeat protein